MLRYLRPYKFYLLQLGLAMLIAAVLGLILPFLTQSVVDTGIGNSNLSFVVMILVAQVVLTLGQMANNLIRSWLMLHMTTRISISLISDFLAKLMRLPIAFFDSKMVGDIMQRIGDYNRIQTFLTGSLLSIVMAAVSLVIYSVVMAGYDLGILGVFLLGSGLYILWILIFLKKCRKLDYMRFQESANNQSNIVQLINGMQDIGKAEQLREAERATGSYPGDGSSFDQQPDARTDTGSRRYVHRPDQECYHLVPCRQCRYQRGNDTRYDDGHAVHHRPAQRPHIAVHRFRAGYAGCENLARTPERNSGKTG